MKVATIFKWGMNPADQLASEDGSVKWMAKRPETGDDDHAAISAAVSAANGDEVIGFTVNSGETAFSAARGADRTVALEGWDIDLQPIQIAQIFATAVQKEGSIEIVTIGDSVWNPMVPSLLAGMLGWQMISAVDEVKNDGDQVVVSRRFGTGTQDIVITKPTVLAVSARREEEDKPGMRVVLQARKKPIQTLDVQELKLDATGCYRVKEYRKPDVAAARIFDASVDFDASIAQMVQCLQAEGVL